MKKLYVLRHGETDYNIQERYQWQSDIEMNKNGENQAKILIHIIEELMIDLIIVSPTKRAHKMANIINTKNIPIIESPNFAERNMGVYEWLTREEAKQLYPNLWNSNITRIYDKAPTKGETIQEVETRVFSKLNELKKNTVENILIVTHAFTSKIINKYYNPNISEEEFFKFAIKNGEIIMYEF